MAGINTAEGDGADEGVIHDFESKHGEGLFILGKTNGFFFGFEIDALDRFTIERRRQIVDNRIKQRLNAFVFEGRATQNRIEGTGHNSLTDQTLQHVFRRLFAVEIVGHGRIIELNSGLDQLQTVFFGLLKQVSRNFFITEAGAEIFIIPHNGFHANEIDNPFEEIFRTNRQLDADRLASNAINDFSHAVEEVSAGLVHLVDEHDTRNIVFVSLTPHGFGLWLNALVTVENADSTVEHSQRTLDFNGEVNVAGGVDDVQTLAVPEGGGRSGGNRDATLLLLLHPIHGGSTFVHFADFMRLAAVVKDPFSGRRFPCIDVGHDAEITIVLNCVNAGH